MGKDAIFGGPRLLRQEKFIETTIQARKFARALVANQIDAFGGGRQPLIIVGVPPKPHKILGEANRDGTHLLPGSPADFLCQFINALHGILPRGKLFQNILDALVLRA